MLSAEQVIPFLSSDDAILSGQAYTYFRFANDVAPLTSTHCWNAINRHGFTPPSLHLIDLLKYVPQDDESTRQFLAALDSELPPRVRNALLLSLSEIDLEQLLRHREPILSRPDLSKFTREMLQTRLRLSELTQDDLWGELEKLANASENELWRAFDHREDVNRIEALTRFGESSATRAMAILNDGKYKDSALETFSIQLLGRLRYRPALDLVLHRLLIQNDEEDFLYEDFEDALPRIGGVDAVAPIEEHFPKRAWTMQITMSAILARVRQPAAEAALLRLFDAPNTNEAQDNIAFSLAELCTTDGLPKLREIVVEEDYDKNAFDLKENLVACALMAGFDFPELPTMREEVIARNAETQRRLEETGSLDDMDDDFNEADHDDDLDQDSDDAEDEIEKFSPALEDREPPPSRTIINEQPKIGRNDPCPCGSGKKYKKCCLK